MFGLRGIAARIFGSSNDRRIAKYRGKVDAINAMEPELEALSDEALRARTAMFREQLAAGTDLDELLVPAFAFPHGTERSLELRRQMPAAKILLQCWLMDLV